MLIIIRKGLHCNQHKEHYINTSKTVWYEQLGIINNNCNIVVLINRMRIKIILKLINDCVNYEIKNDIFQEDAFWFFQCCKQSE